MIITFASGRGGTGKTAVSVNLARVLGRCFDELVEKSMGQWEEPGA